MLGIQRMKVKVRSTLGEFEFEVTLEELRKLLSPIEESSVKVIEEPTVAKPRKSSFQKENLGFTEHFRTSGEIDLTGKSRTQYVYFKNPDSSYLVEIQGENDIPLEKIFLGSYKEQDSRISEFISKILPLRPEEALSRAELFGRLENKWWSNPRRMRAAIEILIKEGLIEQASKGDTKPVKYRKNPNFNRWNEFDHILMAGLR